LTKKKWAPSDVTETSLWLQNVYERWHNLKDSLDLEQRCYLEIKLEELAASPREMLSEVAGICGLEDSFENLPNIQIERVNNWQDEMSSQEIQKVNDVLSSHIEWLGYA
jgi:hypothetical protein